ncbi:hypothetical protein ACP4OV_027391 [Aristida adscensionis]
MELGGGGRGTGDRARRQLQAAGRLAAYLGGGFLLLSAASSVAVRSLRALSDANQVRGLALPSLRSADLGFFVRDAMRRLRGGGELRVQAVQGRRHGRVVPDARPGVRQPVPLPDLRRVQRCLNCLGRGYA